MEFECLYAALINEKKDKDLQDVLLTNFDFQFMQNLNEAFAPIFTCTKLLQTQEMPMSDLLKNWYACKMELDKLDESSNVFTGPLNEAFKERGDTLMANVAFAAAVYLDPRFYHSASSSKLFGSSSFDIEVRFYFEWVEMVIIFLQLFVGLLAEDVDANLMDRRSC